MEDSKPYDEAVEAPRMAEPAGSPETEGEPFACPHCGQMLAASCRVCVSCKEPVDPSKIIQPIVAPSMPAQETAALPAVRFPWPIFLVVLGASWFTAIGALQFLGVQKSQLLVGAIQIGSAAWVVVDARARRLPKPWRWGLGSLFLWIVIFPWYLARRRAPKAVCPFVEAEAGPLARLILIVLLVFFLSGLVMMFLKGPVKP